jgi:hypothetical protein
MSCSLSGTLTLNFTLICSLPSTTCFFAKFCSGGRIFYSLSHLSNIAIICYPFTKLVASATKPTTVSSTFCICDLLTCLCQFSQLSDKTYDFLLSFPQQSPGQLEMCTSSRRPILYCSLPLNLLSSHDRTTVTSSSQGAYSTGLHSISELRTHWKKAIVLWEHP